MNGRSHCLKDGSNVSLGLSFAKSYSSFPQWSESCHVPLQDVSGAKIKSIISRPEFRQKNQPTRNDVDLNQLCERAGAGEIIRLMGKVRNSDIRCQPYFAI
jgi:hypothetical protein